MSRAPSLLLRRLALAATGGPTAPCGAAESRGHSRRGRGRHGAHATVVALAVALAGCDDTDAAGGGGDDLEGPWATFEERPCPPGSTVDGQSFGIPFLLTWCSGCHGGQVPIDERQDAPLDAVFDDLDQVRSQAAAIWGQAGDDRISMPPAGGPTPEERRLLGEWLACGAPLQIDVP
jgi:hypothetical protein